MCVYFVMASKQRYRDDNIDWGSRSIMGIRISLQIQVLGMFDVAELRSLSESKSILAAGTLILRRRFGTLEIVILGKLWV